MNDIISHIRSRLSNTEFFLLFFSLLIGSVAAVGAIFFRKLIYLIQQLFWSVDAGFLSGVMSAPWWQKVLVPTFGGLVAGVLITYVVPEAKGPGVPEVIIAVTNMQSRIRHRVTILKALITGLLIGTGASVGREGPVVQIGASVGSSIAQMFNLNPDLRRVCLASGAAAGIAATFNAPIAGAMFAMEIILLDMEITYISHIIIAAVVASVGSKLFWGEFITFNFTPFILYSYSELYIYLFLGISAGLLGILFIRMIYGFDHLFEKIRLPDWIKPAIGGLILGGLILVVPQVAGVGYETVNAALGNSIGLKLVLIILAAKLLATSMSIGSGMSGGIFAPSLFLGAALGLATGIVADQLFPQLAISPGCYALVGMGAFVAGTTLAPITAVLTLFELTYSYEIILPLMVACISSVMFVRLFFGYSAYEMKLIRKGVNIVRGHDVGRLKDIRVTDVMLYDYETITNSATLAEVAKRMADSTYPHYVVLNQAGELVGMLSINDLQHSLDKYENLKDLIVVDEVMTKDVLYLTTQDDLKDAFHLFEKKKTSCLPVVQPNNHKKVVGLLKRHDFMLAYEDRGLKDRLISKMK